MICYRETNSCLFRNDNTNRLGYSSDFIHLSNWTILNHNATVDRCQFVIFTTLYDNKPYDVGLRDTIVLTGCRYRILIFKGHLGGLIERVSGED